MLWWVPTLLLPLVGGVMAWLGLRNTRFRQARIMLGVGLAIGVIASMVFASYSYQIAAYLTGASRETVITQPSTTIP
jgi:cytochrome bd-type quinol oxidase subunit 1